MRWCGHFDDWRVCTNKLSLADRRRCVDVFIKKTLPCGRLCNWSLDYLLFIWYFALWSDWSQAGRISYTRTDKISFDAAVRMELRGKILNWKLDGFAGAQCSHFRWEREREIKCEDNMKPAALGMTNIRWPNSRVCACVCVLVYWVWTSVLGLRDEIIGRDLLSFVLLFVLLLIFRRHLLLFECACFGHLG